MQYFQAKMFDGTVDTEMCVCLAGCAVGAEPCRNKASDRSD